MNQNWTSTKPTVLAASLFIAVTAIGFGAPETAVACSDFVAGSQGHLFVKGLQAFKNNEFAKAAGFFAEAADKGDIDLVYLNLGFSLAGAGRCQEAWQAYGKVLEAPNICGAPTKEEVAADLKYAVEQLGAECPSFVEVQCPEGADQYTITRVREPGSLPEWMKASTKREGLACSDSSPVLLWPGLYEVEPKLGPATDGVENPRQTFALLADEYKKVSVGSLAELVVACDKEADVSLNGTYYRRCYDTVTLRLPPGAYEISGVADDESVATRGVRLTDGAKAEVNLHSTDLVRHAEVTWEVPIEVSVLAVSDGVADGLLGMMDDPGSGELLRLGFGPRFTWDRASLSPRLTGSYGRLHEEMRQLGAEVSARSLAAGLDLEFGYDLLGRDVLDLRAAVGIGAAFYSVRDVVSLTEPGLEVEPSGAGLRLSGGLRACTGAVACLGVLVGTDSQVALETADAADNRSAALDSQWVMVQLSIELVRALRATYFP